MSTYTLPHFGAIHPEELKDYYVSDLQLDHRTIELDINFEGDSTTTDVLDTISRWLGDPEKLDAMGRAALKQDFEHGTDVMDYLQHHIEELGGSGIRELTEGMTGATDEAKLFGSLELQRIGFYPDVPERFISLDYTLSGNVSDYLLVLDMNAKAELQFMTMES